MGLYTAPPHGTQQQFLLKYGRIIDAEEVMGWDYYNATELPVAYIVPNTGKVTMTVLSPNGVEEIPPYLCNFEASMVVCNTQDAARVTDPKETRVIIFYAVPVSVLVDPTLGQVPPDRLRAYRPYIIDGTLYE